MSLFFITLGSEKKTLRSYLDKERAQILKYINFTLKPNYGLEAQIQINLEFKETTLAAGR